MLKDETVERALVEIRKGNAEYVYFFDHVNSVAWLEPLSRHGFFQTPPAPVRREQYISFPPWPESRYLVRMSAIPEVQAKVLEIVLRIPATDNIVVQDDLLEVALNLPPQQSAALVPRVCEWVQAPIKGQLPFKVGNLIAHLAESGEEAAALTLARAALALGPDTMVAKEDEESLLWPEPRPRFQDFYYQDIVASAFRSLVKATGLHAIRLFCDLLNDWIKLSRSNSDNSDEDYLSHRQPAIEDRGPHDVPSALICAVRDAAELLIKDGHAQFREVIDILRSKPWVTFRRLELHLSRSFPDGGREIAEGFFQNPERIDESGLRHEAVLLLQASFCALSPKTQGKVLLWMEQGPPEDNVRRWLEHFPEPVTDEGIRAVSDEWRRDRFAVLKGQLPEAYEAKLADLVARLGESRPLGEPERIRGGAIGPKSPKSIEDLNQMELDGVLSFLASWNPGTEMFAPTAEGLGRNLAAIVGKRPNDFAPAAGMFRSLDPTYVRSLIEGLTQALKQRLVFDWRPALDLAVWVVNQPRTIPDRKGGLMVADPDWGWTRDAIIDLVTAGFDDTPGKLACRDRSLIWQAIRPLTDDPNPPLQSETGANFDPTDLSINSTRGRALYAVVRYAWWVRGCVEAAGQPSPTFDAMPEVREVLDAHLDPSTEPGVMARAVYGQSIPSFAGLDWDWLRLNLCRILPEDEADDPRFVAAWESFVSFAQPHPALLPLLTPAYRRAANRIGKPGLVRHPISPDVRLSEHLMLYYWWGKLEFEDDSGILDTFYAVASDKLRSHALWFIKNLLGQTGAPPEAYERVQRLMERRLATAKVAPSPDEFSEELANFGYWFASGKFEERWAVKTLLSTLRLTRKVYGDRNVMSRLVELSLRYPVECIECLRHIIEGDRERWVMVLAEATAREVLRVGLESNNPLAVLAARRLVQDVIALGYFEFRTLLK